MISALRRRSVVRQYDQADCGPAALLTALRHLGGDASLATVRSLAGTDARGTSLASLVEAATRLGLRARGATGTLDDLAGETLPCIAHVVNERRLFHFVVVYSIGKRVAIGDPGLGRRSITRADFERIWVTRAVVLLEPTEALVSDRPPHWVAWLAGYCRADSSWLTQTVFLGLVYTALALATSVLIKGLVDSVIPSHDLRRVWIMGAALATAQCLRAGCGWLRQRFLTDVGARVSVRMTQDFLGHIFRLPASFFDSRSTGDITSRVADAVKIQGAILRAVGSTLTDVFLLGGSLTVVCFLAPALGWYAIGATVLYGAVLYPLTRPIRDQQGRAMQAYAAVESTYIDSLTGAHVVAAFTASSYFAHLNATLFATFQEHVRRLGLRQAAVAACAEVVGGILVTSMLVSSAVLVIHKELELGVLLAVYSLVATALPAIARLLETNVVVQGAAVASARLLDLLNAPPEVDDGRQSFRMEHGLSLRGVTHRWPNGPVVLHDVSLEIPRGEVTALLGSSGAGKSTLVTLLERRYAPTAGCVFVDALAAAQVTLDSFRRNVVVVPEAAKMFKGTLASNIELGRGPTPGAISAELIRTFQLEEFIGRFSLGLMTPIGEGGRHLSSGERQVVTLLRALLSRPAVLIVDEGLNAMDMELASLVLRLLRAYSRDHAVLLISHNPVLISWADRSYNLRNGRITVRDPMAPEDGFTREEHTRAADRPTMVAVHQTLLPTR